MMLRRLEHKVVLAVAIQLGMIIAFNAIMLTPRWKFQPFAPVLVVVDGQDRIRLHRILDALNPPVIAVDGAQDRGVVSTEPQLPGAPPIGFFVLEFR